MFSHNNANSSRGGPAAGAGGGTTTTTSASSSSSSSSSSSPNADVSLLIATCCRIAQYAALTSRRHLADEAVQISAVNEDVRAMRPHCCDGETSFPTWATLAAAGAKLFVHRPGAATVKLTERGEVLAERWCCVSVRSTLSSPMQLVRALQDTQSFRKAHKEGTEATGPTANNNNHAGAAATAATAAAAASSKVKNQKPFVKGHINVIWPSIADVPYWIAAPGDIVVCGPPDAVNQTRFDRIHSSRCLFTRAFRFWKSSNHQNHHHNNSHQQDFGDKQPLLRHCRSYFCTAYCHLGSDCQFIHAISLPEKIFGLPEVLQPVGFSRTSAVVAPAPVHQPPPAAVMPVLQQQNQLHDNNATNNNFGTLDSQNQQSNKKQFSGDHNDDDQQQASHSEQQRKPEQEDNNNNNNNNNNNTTNNNNHSSDDADEQLTFLDLALCRLFQRGVMSDSVSFPNNTNYRGSLVSDVCTTDFPALRKVREWDGAAAAERQGIRFFKAFCDWASLYPSSTAVGNQHHGGGGGEEEAALVVPVGGFLIRSATHIVLTVAGATRAKNLLHELLLSDDNNNKNNNNNNSSSSGKNSKRPLVTNAQGCSWELPIHKLRRALEPLHNPTEFAKALLKGFEQKQQQQQQNKKKKALAEKQEQLEQQQQKHAENYTTNENCPANQGGSAAAAEKNGAVDAARKNDDDNNNDKDHNTNKNNDDDDDENVEYAIIDNDEEAAAVAAAADKDNKNSVPSFVFKPSPFIGSGEVNKFVEGESGNNNNNNNNNNQGKCHYRHRHNNCNINNKAPSPGYQKGIEHYSVNSSGNSNNNNNSPTGSTLLDQQQQQQQLMEQENSRLRAEVEQLRRAFGSLQLLVSQNQQQVSQMTQLIAQVL